MNKKGIILATFGSIYGEAVEKSGLSQRTFYRKANLLLKENQEKSEDKS